MTHITKIIVAAVCAVMIFAAPSAWAQEFSLRSHFELWQEYHPAFGKVPQAEQVKMFCWPFSIGAGNMLMEWAEDVKHPVTPEKRQRAIDDLANACLKELEAK